VYQRSYSQVGHIPPKMSDSLQRNVQQIWESTLYFSTIFQLYIDLWATFPGANMVQGRNTLGYLRTQTFYIPERKYAYNYTLQVYQRSYSQVGHIPPKMSDSLQRNVQQIWESTLSMSDYLVRHRCRTWEWIFKDFFYISHGEHVKHFKIIYIDFVT
jgi:hypothetical protein